jgi:hypothetical protein
MTTVYEVYIPKNTIIRINPIDDLNAPFIILPCSSTRHISEV